MQRKANFAISAHFVAVTSDYLEAMDDKWFKLRQKQVGVTADQIAARLGRDRSVVSKILNGKQRMTLEWAQAFADVLDCPLATVLEKAGVAEPEVASRLRNEVTGGDAQPWSSGSAHEDARLKSLTELLAPKSAGASVWRVTSKAMALAGYLQGDFLVVDTNLSERVKGGDAVVAEVYDLRAGTLKIVLRRYEPPALVAATVAPETDRVHVADGVNVVVKGKVVASWRV